MNGRTLVMAVALLAAACSGKETSASGKGQRGRGPMQFPVEVEPVDAQAVEYVVNAVGSVEAFERVQVTARVAGAVEKVRFQEGQQVKAGDVLAEIELSRFRLAVRAARAAREKADAMLAEARAAFERREAVSAKNPGLIRGEELEAFRTQARTAAAELSSAQVALEQAELNLRDASVRAPIAGIIQTRTVQTGQYVQVGSVLATLMRREPLLLRFKVTEPDAARISAGLTARFRVRDDGEAHQARITHVSASADESTRMVTVTGEVEGEGRQTLRPGAFAEVTVPVGNERQSLVIPQTAVRPSERGFLAYVVEGDKARERVLTLGLRTADGRVEVKRGLSAGDRLVVRGAEALKDGAQVRVAGGEPGQAKPRSAIPSSANPSDDAGGGGAMP